MKESDIEQKAETAIRGCLEGPPFIQSVEFEKGLSGNSSRSDLIARIAIGNRERVILVELKNNGEPRYTRQAINKLSLVLVGGKVLPVGGVQQKIRAAYDAGIKEVILPIDNLNEAQTLPSYILEGIKLIPVETIG